MNNPLWAGEPAVIRRESTSRSRSSEIGVDNTSISGHRLVTPLCAQSSKPAGRDIARWLMRLVSTSLLATTLMACAAGKNEGIGTGITGIDHLADHLSVQNFWVDGYNAAQAGKGGRNVCCATLPRKWRPDLKVQIRWEVADWKAGKWTCRVREVPVEPYEEVGQLWVHFLADGSVRVVTSNVDPYSPIYPGPRDRIPPKHPWDQYPPPAEDSECHRRVDLNK